MVLGQRLKNVLLNSRKEFIMNEKDLKVNEMIMREIGLEVGHGNKIVDQDTGVPLTVGTSYIMAPGAYCGRQNIEFDPYNNRKLMGNLFGMYLEKYADESGIDCSTYYDVNHDKKTQASAIECRMSDNSLITSRPYIRDSLKYADIILQLNGEENVDLSEYDGLPDAPTVKRRTRKS